MSYYPNEKIIEEIKKHGFIETSRQENLMRGKRSFKLSINSRKEIRLDHSTIRIINGSHIYDNTCNLSESDFKSILLYFKLPSFLLLEICPQRKFKFNRVQEKLKSLKDELNGLKQCGALLERTTKLDKLFSIYNNL